jgi:hypothetical protein
VMTSDPNGSTDNAASGRMGSFGGFIDLLISRILVGVGLVWFGLLGRGRLANVGAGIGGHCEAAERGLALVQHVVLLLSGLSFPRRPFCRSYFLYKLR